MYTVVRTLFYAISLLPYRALYVIADFFYLIIYYIVGYRKRVVKKNLANSFPEKSEEERKEIERKFYRWLCDYFVETLKLISVSDETFMKHVRFEGMDVVEQCFAEGQDCAGILGHHGNWEYLSASDLGLTSWGFRAVDNGSKATSKAAVCGLIYHPLSNKIFDRLFLEIRQAMRGVCVPKKDILRYLVNYRREGRKTLFGYIADQAPKWENIHLWLDFLNQETPVFTGAERILSKMNNAVFYIDVERPRRGQYVFTYKLMTREPSKMEHGELTRQYFKLLENSIRRNPSIYLWTHDRWKRTREEFERRYVVKNGHVVRNAES
jgi:KDO2-lipid IV(A) lauroyltransferase